MNLVFPFKMGAGMGGPHRFQIHLKTNDPAAPTKILEVTALAQ